jgi:predicted nucleic acid-binding protein
MGLITGLLTLPLAPVRGVAWVAEVLADEADRELAASESPERALADLEAARATGEITEEEFAEREADLVDALIVARAREEGR